VGAEQSSITLHSTWRFLIGSAVGAIVVAAAGTYGVIAAGFNAITTLVALTGWFFVGVVALDLPIASTFTADGVRRHLLLRRQFLAWEPGDALTRSRPSLMRHESRLRQGGLVLRRGRRRYLLVDKAESPDEYAAVVGSIDVPGSPGELVDVSGLPGPPSSAPPTWLYRRRSWRPDGTLDR
jgi:hypothetical protein